MRFDNNGGGSVNYEPNSFNGPAEDKTTNEPPLVLEGDAYNHNHRDDKDYYTQPGDLYRLVSEDEKHRIASNVAAAMAGVPVEIIIRAIARFYQADEHCGADIAAHVGIDLAKVKEEIKRQQAE
jgi:catalase